jgi:hypothetical protein
MGETVDGGKYVAVSDAGKSFVENIKMPITQPKVFSFLSPTAVE